MQTSLAIHKTACLPLGGVLTVSKATHHFSLCDRCLRRATLCFFFSAVTELIKSPGSDIPPYTASEIWHDLSGPIRLPGCLPDAFGPACADRSREEEGERGRSSNQIRDVKLFIYIWPTLTDFPPSVASLSVTHSARRKKEVRGNAVCE